MKKLNAPNARNYELLSTAFRLYLLLLVFAPSSFGQELPLTLAKILTGLQTQGRTAEIATLAARNRFIAGDVRRLGITFELNDEREKDLREAGANEELISAIRDVSNRNRQYTQSVKAAEFANKARSCGQEDYECRITNYTKAIEAKPSNDQLYSARASAYNNKGDNEAAVADISIAIKLNASEKKYYKWRAVYYHNVGKHLEAATDYGTAINYEPQEASNYLNRGKEYAELGLFQGALNDYNKSLELDPKNGYAYSRRASVYVSQKRNEDALADYTRAIEFSSTEPFWKPFYYQWRADLYVNLQKYEAALADYNKCLELSPEYTAVYSLRANVYEKMGDTVRAQLDRKTYQSRISVVTIPREKEDIKFSKTLGMSGGGDTKFDVFIPSDFNWYRIIFPTGKPGIRKKAIRFQNQSDYGLLLNVDGTEHNLAKDGSVIIIVENPETFFAKSLVGQSRSIKLRVEYIYSIR